MTSPLDLIDSHCHLNYDYAPKSTDDLIREAREAGVGTLMTIGTDLKTIDEIQAISDRYAQVFHTVGVHPHDAVLFESEDPIPLLKSHARHPKCRGIGEIGLDYHYDHSPRDVQIRALNTQLQLAVQLKLPVVIHSREGEADLLLSLKEYCKNLEPGSIPGLIHCFTGTREFGEACLKLGFFISFSGILTFKNAGDLRDCAAAFPLDRILVETDSPYLAPVPFRGKKCEPKMVKQVAEKLAEIKGSTLEQIASQTTLNAKRLFKLESSNL